MSASDKNSGLGPDERGAAWGALSPRLQEVIDAGGVREQTWGRGLQPGAVIGHFELLQEIGRGSSGVVWEARDQELGRTVAFKAVRADKNPELRERLQLLLREVEAAARLSHPNIVTLFDVGRSEHGSYLILELLHGETLAKRLEQGPLPLKETLVIGMEVAKGLAHALAQGIVHRDLTPDNVFLCDDGRVMLLEFALTHALGGPRAPSGVAPYTAPEQWQGNPGDPRTDVFALGVILFEMLSGDLPFSDDGGRTEQAGRPAPRLTLTQETQPGWLARFRHAVRTASSFVTGHRADEGLGDLVERMLEKDPLKRPQSMAQILPALARLQKAAPRSASVGILASASESQPGGCGAFETTLEEVAFRGQEPTGDFREHLASCPRCADRLERERALYGVPPELKARVLKQVAREAGFVPSLDAKPGRLRRILQAVPDALSPAPARQPVDELESRIRKASAAGGPKVAATEAIREVGPSVLGYLHAVLRNEAEANEAFSQWAERLWAGLSTYHGPLSFKAWAFQLARKEALNLRKEAYRVSQRLESAEAVAIADDLRARSVPPLEGKRRLALDKLREALTAEERSLLVLRIDQGLPWDEIAEIMAVGGKPADSAALNKLFEQLKVRLARLARDQGLLR